MEVNFCVADHAALIERILDGFIQASELLYRSGAAKGPPSLAWELVDDGNPETWKLPTQVEEDGVCDCEDLVIAWAGWLRATGEDPRAGARIATVSPGKVHCLLRRGDGTIDDIWAIHTEKQKQFEMAGLFSAIKKGAKAVGKGVKAAAGGVKDAAVGVGKGVKAAAVGVKDAAGYVAKDLPKAVLKEGASGLESLVRGVAGAGSQVINAVGDVVAQGAGDALGQWGKLGREVADSFSSEPAAPVAMPPGYDPAAGYPGGYMDPSLGVDMSTDPWGGADPWAGDPYGGAGDWDPYGADAPDEEYQPEWGTDEGYDPFQSSEEEAA